MEENLKARFRSFSKPRMKVSADKTWIRSVPERATIHLISTGTHPSTRIDGYSKAVAERR